MRNPGTAFLHIAIITDYSDCCENTLLEISSSSQRLFIFLRPTVTLFSIKLFILVGMDWCLFWDLCQAPILLLLNTKLKMEKS